MSEETKQEAVQEQAVQEQAAEKQPVQETVTITEKEMEAIDKEITAEDDAKVAAVKEEVDAELEAMKKELSEIQARNAEIERQRKLEEEKAALKAQIEKEQAYAEQVNKKHVVAPSENPINNQNQTPSEQVQISKQEQWAAFHQATKSGAMSAKIDPEEFKFKK